MESVHSTARVHALLHLFRVFTVLSIGEYDIPSRESSERYLFLRTAPAVSSVVGAALFQLGRACAHDVEFLCQTVLP
eukprot:4215285-Prymnesium_polylepis.1